MANKDDRPVAIDLFAGAGGLSEGLLAAGINVAVAVEHHPHPALTHAFNHPGTAVIRGDICNLKAETIKKLVKKQTGRTKVDIIAGGPPCQGFSVAGKCDKNDKRNKLFKQFLKLVKDLEPSMFLFENVPGFVRMYDGVAYQEVCEGFTELGYTLHASPDKDFPLQDAAWYGVPQNRRRFILVGWKEGKLAKDFKLPRRHYLKVTKQPTIEKAIGDLEFLKMGKEHSHHRKDPVGPYQQERRKKVAWANTRGLLFNHLASNHRDKTVERFKLLKPGKSIRSIQEKIKKKYPTKKQCMRRFARDQVAKAVLALPDDYVHYKLFRIPTVREMARLQSFDDDYVFLGKRTTSEGNRQVDVPQYTQVGNAVPPLLAKAMGKAMVRALRGKELKDFRNLDKRQDRLKWLQGSSGLRGYTLKREDFDKLELYDINGEKLQGKKLESHPDSLLKDSIASNEIAVHALKKKRPRPWPKSQSKREKDFSRKNGKVY